MLFPLWLTDDQFGPMTDSFPFVHPNEPPGECVPSAELAKDDDGIGSVVPSPGCPISKWLHSPWPPVKDLIKPAKLELEKFWIQKMEICKWEKCQKYIHK